MYVYMCVIVHAHIYIHIFIYWRIYWTAHEKLPGTQRVSNQFTTNQRISTLAHSVVVQIGKYVCSEFMVQIKRKGVYGVEDPRAKASRAETRACISTFANMTVVVCPVARMYAHVRMHTYRHEYIHKSIDLVVFSSSHTHLFDLFVYSSTDTCMCIHISWFVCLFIYRYFYMCVSIHLQIRICVHTSLHLCVYSSATYMCVCLFICNVYVYTYLLICLSIHQLTHIYLRCVYEYVQIHISADSHIYWFVCLFIHTHTCITLVVCAVACMNIYRLTYLLSHVPIILYTHVYRHNILWSSHTCLQAEYPLIFTHMSTGTVSFDLYTHVYRHTCKCDSGGARAIPSSNPAVALLSSSRSRCLYWHSPIWFFFFWNSVLLNCLLLNYLLLNYLLSFELFTFLNLNYLPFFWTVYCRQRGRAVFTRILPSGFYFFLNWILAYILVYFLFWTICCRRRGHAVFTGNLPSGFFFLEIFTRIYTCVFFGGNYLLRSRCLDWHSIIWSFFFWTM